VFVIRTDSKYHSKENYYNVGIKFSIFKISYILSHAPTNEENDINQLLLRQRQLRDHIKLIRNLYLRNILYAY